MKILVLSSEFPPGPGGIGTHAYELASGLQRLGERVMVLTLQDYVSEADRSAFNSKLDFEIQALSHKRFMIQEGLYRLDALIQAIRCWQPDVMIATGERSTWLMAAANAVFRKPWMAVGHGTEFSQSGIFHMKLTRWAFRQARLCIAVSQYTRGEMIAYGIPARSIRVIPNGANFEEMNEFDRAAGLDFRVNRGFSQDQILMLTVGNLSHRKGQDIVIRALPEVIAAGWDVHYLLVGMPTLAADLAALAQRCGVQDRVHFLGQLARSIVLQAYQACDIFVLTSRKTREGDYEGYGIVAIEAALAGKPAVVTRCGGLPEAVIDGVTGLVVNEEDPIATAFAVTRLLAAPDLAERLGRQGRERALLECLWSHRVASYHKHLEDMA